MHNQAQLKQQIAQLEQFVADEKAAALQQLKTVWSKNLDAKLASGQTQRIDHLELLDNRSIRAQLGNNESRFREGDIVRLYLDDPVTGIHLTELRLEALQGDEWLLHARQINQDSFVELANGCLADPCFIDLQSFYQKALNEVASSNDGRVILPLLSGQLINDQLDLDDYDELYDSLGNEGFNEQQRDAIALGVLAKQLACIQGPPGTGKTRVIAKIAQLLVQNNERVLLTSHTHMAINNALNKICPLIEHTVKIGSLECATTLVPRVKKFTHAENWQDMPDCGYVIGATPFATCGQRLEAYSFDTVIFDEASQITLPLALMAMRKGKRFVFVGDHKQLPPVVLSQSILGNHNSAFASLLQEHNQLVVMLNETYRMNQWLAAWPSQTYYQGALKSSGNNQQRRLPLNTPPGPVARILDPAHPLVFIPSPGAQHKNKNEPEAKLVTEIILAAVNAGLASSEIGVVTPFRLHAKNIRHTLAKQGINSLIVDTVERMQGQEMELVILSLCSTEPGYVRALADFLFMPERLNVSITRAKSKLIIIGPRLSTQSFSSANSHTQTVVAQYLSLIGSATQHDLMD